MILTIKRFLSRRSKGLLAAICVFGAITPAYADGASVGQVGIVVVVGAAGGAPGYYDLRVFLAGMPAICNGLPYAYANSGEANYSGILANVLSARGMGAPITLSWTQTSSGFCQITSVAW